jgi:hypothetical protein
MTEYNALISISSLPSLESFDSVVKAEHRKIHDGDQLIVFFRNSYGASVVRHSYSYGGTEGFYELAVIREPESEDEEFVIDYDTSLGCDVIGWLDGQEVVDKLKEIQSFPNYAIKINV